MKREARRRRSRAQVLAEQQQLANEKYHVDCLKQAEAELQKRNYSLQDAMNAIEQNQKMLVYMREKDLIDEKGNAKV